MKPVCHGCQRFFRPAKNGFYFTEGMPKDNDARPGTDDADKWEPYKLWVGDLWRCQGCGATIVIGVPHNPIAEHYEEGFAEKRMALRGGYQVNDC